MAGRQAPTRSQVPCLPIAPSGTQGSHHVTTRCRAMPAGALCVYVLVPSHTLRLPCTPAGTTSTATTSCWAC